MAFAARRTNYTQIAITPNMQLTPTARLEPTQIHLLATNDSTCVHTSAVADGDGGL